MTHKLIVIGGGPAGYTAALYAARATLKPFVIEGLSYGGQLMTTSEVENYPGFPKGVDGKELMAHFRDQAERFGAEFLSRDVTKVDLRSDPKKVWVEDDLYEATAVIVATGAGPRKLGIPGEDALWARGVSSCATCDGAFFKNRVIMVVGGGDSAMEEATFLTRYGSKVYVTHRRDELRASKIMQERAKANPKIEFLWSTVPEEILGDGHVTGVRLRSAKTGERFVVPIDGFFLAIGHIPNTKLFEGQLEMDENGYLETVAGSMKTGIPGVFACGDCVDHVYRQAITAAGMGCMAAIDCERYLESLHQ
jgi:thioredoxin reductase (NADPH)